MGLDEFLIPQEPTPSTLMRSIDGLGDVLVAPPIGLESPESEMGPALDDLAMRILSEPPAGGGIAPLVQMPELGSAVIGDVGLSSRSVKEVLKSPASTAPESIRIDVVGSRSPQPFSALTPETAGKLENFLVTPVPVINPSSEDIDGIPSDFVSPSQFLQIRWEAPSASTPTPNRGGLGTTSKVAASAQAPPWEAGFGPSSVAWPPPDGSSDGRHFGEEQDQLSDRLSQVAYRLERAVDRLASPSQVLGSRPKSFRGRTGG